VTKKRAATNHLGKGGKASSQRGRRERKGIPTLPRRRGKGLAQLFDQWCFPGGRSGDQRPDFAVRRRNQLNPASPTEGEQKKEEMSPQNLERKNRKSPCPPEKPRGRVADGSRGGGARSAGNARGENEKTTKRDGNPARESRWGENTGTKKAGSLAFCLGEERCDLRGPKKRKRRSGRAFGKPISSSEVWDALDERGYERGNLPVDKSF